MRVYTLYVGLVSFNRVNFNPGILKAWCRRNYSSVVLNFAPQVLFDGHLSSSILFSYNAKAVDGQLCLEASPNENQSFFAHSPHATLLEVRSMAP